VLELLAAFEEADWQRKLPQLAERLMDMGPSDAARLKARQAACLQLIQQAAGL
jgi:hypothetical protein